MKEEFHVSDKISNSKMKELLLKSNRPALFRFIIMYFIFLSTSISIIVCWDKSWFALLPAFALFGIIGCSLFACEHETIHNTAFKSDFLNRMASLLAGLGHMYAPTAFRDLHFTHHKFTHVPGKDPEISLGNKPMPSAVANIPNYLGWITGIPLILFKTVMLVFGAIGMPEIIRQKFFPFIRPEIRFKLAIESISILSIYMGIVLLACCYHSGFWGILIGQVFSHCLLASYLIMEHNGLPHEGNIFEKTRSIKTNKFVKFIMWNMPYHAEHHAYPGIPFHTLPQIHDELSDEIINSDEGHLEFHIKVIKGKV
jgi:fatty acid desaturase